MNTIKIVEDSEHIYIALGLSPDRAIELQELTCDAVNRYDSITEAMDIMQVFTSNNNELAFVNYRIGICHICSSRFSI